MPELKDIILKNHPEADYVFGEFVRGRDNKMRLVRPRRVEQFRLIADGLKRAGFGNALYFCMESDEVWKAVLGFTPKGSGGLGARLMDRGLRDLTVRVAGARKSGLDIFVLSGTIRPATDPARVAFSEVCE